MVILYGKKGVNLPVLAASSIVLILCATGIGFVFAALSVRFRDVLFLLPIIVQLGLYASPVAYGLDVARASLTRHSRWYFDLYMLNPLASVVEAFRWSLLGQGSFCPATSRTARSSPRRVRGRASRCFAASEGKFADVI